MSLLSLVYRFRGYLLLAASAWMGFIALRNMGSTAVYLHEAKRVSGVVVDWRQLPCESIQESLKHGNLPWESETLYQPVLRFRMPNGQIFSRLMPDCDNKPFTHGQEMEVLCMEEDPSQARLYRWKHLWGGDCLLLALAALGGLFAYSSFRGSKAKPKAAKKKPKNSARPAADIALSHQRREAQTPRTEAAPRVAHAGGSKSEQTPAEEEDFFLSAEPPAPRGRQRKADKYADTAGEKAAATKPRRRKTAAKIPEKEAAAEGAKPKRRRKSKETAGT